MTRQDALLRLYNSLRGRADALRKSLAGELNNGLRFRTDPTGDSADGAFDADSEELSAQLADLEAHELTQIKRALARLEQGTYGLCESCQERIPVGRLKALPYSTTCINCQREMESYPGGEGRRGGGWEISYDAEPAMEEQRDIDLADIERETLRASRPKVSNE